MIEFEKVIQIKDFLSKQWSDMFKRYLEILRDNNSNKFIENSVNDLRLLIGKMNVMLDGVGKKILSNDDSKEYEEVIELQNIITLASQVSEVYDLIDISLNDKVDRRRNIIDKLILSTKETIELKLWDNFRDANKEKIKDFFDYFIKNGVNLVYVDIHGGEKLVGILEICKNGKVKELLIKELIKDENYERLIYDKNKL
ncbi:hypothetical protein DS742_19260 [Lacrimispora amygdalina]|uniref:Uncharacterized protein n=1 Tax=Lacrimispora amygdalina TaxID=253257 RepID=A0A3E2N8J1_9FIRM|nr:hypothetical protein [Clostridium indicum]RFZ77329.1 hypothetical protein DS742_19260 [Clostridium indicum]